MRGLGLSAAHLPQHTLQAGPRVEPEDGAGFAAAVRQLVQNPALRQLAEERYGREAVLGQLEGEPESLE